MKKNYWWLMFVIVVVVGLMISSVFVSAEEKAVEIQWEYKIVNAKTKGSMKQQVKQDQPVLNELGKQGWELVTVQYSNYYFKRKIIK
jgi:predicted secreted Zn-dependent protease